MAAATPKPTFHCELITVVTLSVPQGTVVRVKRIAEYTGIYPVNQGKSWAFHAQR
jgi:hypothetical protein